MKWCVIILNSNIIIIIVIILVLAITAFFNNYKPRRKTPEEAIKAYLKFITAKCSIEQFSGPKEVDIGLEYIVTSIDKYNYRNKNNGRKDGQNLHYLYVVKSKDNWHVVQDTSEN
jgi:hypothetical protein